MRTDEPQGKSGLTNDDAFNPDSKEYKLSTSVSFRVADEVSYVTGDVLTMIEAALGSTEQATALKKLLKDRLFNLTRSIQHQVYYAFGQEPYQLGDTDYIQNV
jgi:hypothetical protein